MHATALRVGLAATFVVLGLAVHPDAAQKGGPPAVAKVDRPALMLGELAKDNPILTLRPRAVQEACLRYCPGDDYRALRATWDEAAASPTYTITFFHTEGLRRGGRVGDRNFEELYQYDMTLASDGSLIEEQPHPVTLAHVPPAVLNGYRAWNRNNVKGMVAAWGIEKSRQGKRTFTVSIVFSQIEATGARFLEDGTLIKDQSDPTPRPRPEKRPAL